MLPRCVFALCTIISLCVKLKAGFDTLSEESLYAAHELFILVCTILFSLKGCQFSLSRMHTSAPLDYLLCHPTLTNLNNLLQIYTMTTSSFLCGTINLGAEVNVPKEKDSHFFPSRDCHYGGLRFYEIYYVKKSQHLFSRLVSGVLKTCSVKPHLVKYAIL